MYLLRDHENEKKYSFRLKDSLEKSQKGLRLLENLRLYATSNVKPDHDTLSEILNASGGALELSAPTEKHSIIILSCADDSEEIEKLKNLGFDQIHSMEFILTGLLRQKLDFSR